MYLLIFIGLILLFSITLAKSTSIVIKNVVVLARKFSVPEFAIGFFILGMATSLPEISVAINSAISGTPQLSLGNLLGAIFILTTLVISIPVISAGKAKVKILTSDDLALSAFVISLPALLVFDGTASRIDGVIILSAYLIYVYILNRKESFFEKVRGAILDGKGGTAKLLAILLLGVLGIFLSSRVIVTASLGLAEILSVPALLVGILILAVGTSLPELSLAVKSVTANHRSIGMGDFLGSAAVNSLILSLLFIFKPFVVEDIKDLRYTCVFLVTGVVLLSYFMKTKKELSRKEGLLLLSLYLIFLISEAFRGFLSP